MAQGWQAAAPALGESRALVPSASHRSQSGLERCRRLHHQELSNLRKNEHRNVVRKQSDVYLRSNTLTEGGRVNPRAVIVEGAVEVKSSIGMSGLKH